MVTIAEAMRVSSLEGNVWARHALSTLGEKIDPAMPVVAAVAGWTLRRGSENEELIDTLFVLTDTHLGFGQTSGGVGDPRWIPLISITALDALDDSPLPLQTIEVAIDSSMAMLVGWPDHFTPHFVDSLQRTAGRIPGGVMPTELSGRTPIAADASGLDDLGPSRYTESPVDPAAGSHAPFTQGSPPQSPFSDATAHDEAWATPASPFAAVGSTPEPTQGQLGSHFATAPTHDSAQPSFGGAHMEAEDPPDAPWMQPGCVWPEKVSGVTYRGGDPAAGKKKKKGGLLVFSRRGVEAVGRGRRSWRVAVGWSQVEDIDIKSADEIAFSSGIKINASSSAVVVRTIDGHDIVLEVAQRRTPSLRAGMAPALLMAAGARSWRNEA